MPAARALRSVQCCAGHGGTLGWDHAARHTNTRTPIAIHRTAFTVRMLTVYGGHHAVLQEKFYAAKRRTTQAVLQKLGKAQATPDDEYEERKARALALFTMLKDVSKHCQAYLDHTRGR